MKAKVVTSVKALFIASIFVLSILATITPQTFAVESWADKIASKIDIEYAKFIEHTLTCIGSYVRPEFLGFRATGTPQDYETASFIAEQMEEIGLVNVALEPVPVDAWEFSGAWLTINGGKTYIASSYGGVPGTDKDGITAEIVYVGKGLRPDYERLKADGISVSGKLVLAYWSPEDAWINMIGHEATIHGALGVILYNPPGGTYAQAPNALPSFDACYSSDFVPLIGISKEAAAEILELMKKGPVVGTMVSLVELYQSEGWNTIGYIPGKRSDEYIIFGAHHDAWFFGALDDTGGVAAMMTLARAIKDSGYQPERTLIFTTNTAEEYGCTDAYYDWLIGAWWRITRAHPEWQKRAVAFLNFEGMAFTGAPLEVRVVQELKSFIKRELGRNRKFLPYGWSVTEVYSWADDWPYAAAGVPTIYFAASFTSPSYPYHTQLDTVDIMDWSYLENIMKFCTRVIVDLDQAPIQPYNFETRAENLLDRLNANLMKAAGIDPKPILTEANKFLKVAREFNRVDKKRVPPELADAVQQKIREAARILLSSFTALNVWDYTIYPHEQVELDVTHLRLAIKALEMGDPTTAMRELEWWVSNNWYAPRVSYEVFKRELEHHSPEWPKLNWGGQAHLAPFIDLWQEYNSLAYKKAMGIKDFSDEIASFKSKYAESVEVYRQRIEYITNTLKDVIPLVKEATDLLK